MGQTVVEVRAIPMWMQNLPDVCSIASNKSSDIIEVSVNHIPILRHPPVVIPVGISHAQTRIYFY